MKKKTYINLGIILILFSASFAISILFASTTTTYEIRHKQVYANKGLSKKGSLELWINYKIFDNGTPNNFTWYNSSYNRYVHDDDYEWVNCRFKQIVGVDEEGYVLWVKILVWGDLRLKDHHSSYIHLSNSLTVFNDFEYTGSKSLHDLNMPGIWTATAQNWKN